MEMYETTDTNSLICPYCGYKDPNSWERCESDDECECGRCEKVFAYDTEVIRTFTSVVLTP